VRYFNLNPQKGAYMPRSQKRKHDEEIINNIVVPSNNREVTKNAYIRKLEERKAVEILKRETRKKDLSKQKRVIEQIKKMGEKFIISEEYLRGSIEGKLQKNDVIGEIEVKGSSKNGSPCGIKEVNVLETFRPPTSGFSTMSYNVIQGNQPVKML